MSYYKTPLNITFYEKDIAKQNNAQWDKDKKRWYMFHFSDWKRYQDMHYYTNIETDAYEQLQNVNNIAKQLHKNIFDILPTEYQEYKQSLSNILEYYDENNADVLYNPETYVSDLQEKINKYSKVTTHYTTSENFEWLEKRRMTYLNTYTNLLNKYCSENNIYLQESKQESNDLEMDI